MQFAVKVETKTLKPIQKLIKVVVIKFNNISTTIITIMAQ